MEPAEPTREYPNNGGSGKYVSLRMVISALTFVVAVSVGVIVEWNRADIIALQAKVEKLNDTKVDMEIYKCDIAEIKQGIKDVQVTLWRVATNNRVAPPMNGR